MPSRKGKAPNEPPISTKSPDHAGKAGDQTSGNGLLEFTGSTSLDVGIALVERTTHAMWMADPSDEETLTKTMSLAMEALRGLKPRDEAEGMLAAQMIASHNAAMDCMHRAMTPGQSIQARDMNLKHAAKMMSLYERQLAALDKRRGAGQQKITVEHVTVQAGGQAIVGNVTPEAVAAPYPPAQQLPPQVAALADETAASWDGEELTRALEAKTAKSPAARRG
ncbi:hypothetical protein [Erythrobacter ramosus]|nr:hypothetical protein [Erythrobacter ramosus]MXP39982.1 hypothetical protein [Erythrobacter ramosus]